MSSLRVCIGFSQKWDARCYHNALLCLLIARMAAMCMVRMMRMTTMILVILIRTTLPLVVRRPVTRRPKPVARRPIILEPVVPILRVLLDLVGEPAEIAVILAHGLHVDSYRTLHGRHGAIDKPVANSWLSRSW